MTAMASHTTTPNASAWSAASSRDYVIPDGTRIGHVHLKVSDIERSLEFYCGLLGFTLTARFGADAAFISAGGYHHHIGLNVWHSKNSPPAPRNSVGLYHSAILFPTRRELAVIFDRLNKAGYPITGAADHGVSEALYLDDPDRNGVELYWDKPRELWPKHPDGTFAMVNAPLDLEGLLAELTPERS
jgi:catechol 2,3-dioxygenase